MNRHVIFVLCFLLPPWSAAAQDTVCLQCHSGLEGPLAAPTQQWPGSIHAENGISCHHCHGGDPTDFALAMSPASGFLGVPEETAIPVFCGRCHPGVLADYQDSAHGIALGAGGPHCVTCHGNHAVRKAGPDLINPQDCGRCHEYARAETIRTAMAETDGRIAALQSDLAALHRIGIATGEMEGQVFAARNSFHRLFHSVDVAKVRRQTAAIQEELGEVRQQIAAVEAELSRRKIWGGGATVLLLLVGGVALLLHRDYLARTGPEDTGG